MKKYILFWIFNNRHRVDKGLSKKIFLGLAAVLTFGLLLVGIVTYAGYKTLQFAYNQLPSEQNIIALSNQVQEKVHQTTTRFQLQTCTQALQQRLDLNTWLNRPLTENYTELLQACFKPTGHDQPKTTKETRNDQSHI